MKKLPSILALTLLFCWSAHASTVYVLLSDWLQGAPPLTNYIRVTPVALPVLGNGGTLVTGLPRLFWPTNGVITNSMNQGAYRLEIQNQNWPLPAYFLVGNDNNTYNVTNLLISGGNIFAITGVRQVTSTNGNISISPGNGVGALDLEAGSNVPFTSLANETPLSVLGNMSGSPATPSPQTSLPESFISSLPTDLSIKVSTNDTRSLGFSSPSITRTFSGNTEGFVTAINVADYGLTMTGDQSAVVQAAINAATNTYGQVVNFPAGVYYIPSGITIPPNVVLQGESSQFSHIVSSSSPGAETGTSLYFGSQTGTMVKLSGGGQQIRGIGLYSAGAGIAISSDLSAPTHVSQYVTIEHCRIYGFNIGINGNYLENAMIFDDYLTCQTNVYYTNAANANWIIGGHLGGGIYGVRIDAGTGPECEGNHVLTTIEGCSNGVSSVGTSAFSTEIDLTDAEGNTNDVVINGATGTKIIGGHHDFTVGGTNFVFVGAQGFSIEPDFVYDGSRAFNIDSTSFGGTISVPKFGINPTSFGKLVAAQTYRSWDGTNFVVTGGAYYGNGLGLSNVVNALSVRVDSVYGSDSTGITNDWGHPFLTLTGAVSAIKGSGTMVLTPGETFSLDTNSIFATNLTIVAWGATVIKSNALAQANNTATFGTLTVMGSLSLYGGTWITLSTNSLLFPVFVTSNTTSVTIVGSSLYGMSDVIYGQNANGANIFLSGLYMRSSWDVIALFQTTNTTVTAINCQMDSLYYGNQKPITAIP